MSSPHDRKATPLSPDVSTSESLATRHQKARQVEAEQVRLLYTQAPAGCAATVFNAGIVTVILWGAVAHPVLLVWLTLVIAITLCRYILVRTYRHTTPTPAQIHLWRTRFIVGAGSAGCIWGAAGIFLFAHDSIAHQVFLIFCLGGMAAGAIATLSSVLTAFLAFFLPVLLPITVQLFLQGGTVPLGMGILIMSFGGVLIVVAHHLYASTAESLQLRLENL